MSGKANILFVDDEERVVRLLSIIFRGTYNVFTASGGSAGLEIIRANRIHVVVCDQRMPEMTGIQMLGQVRDISPNTVRLLLTGYSDLVAIIGAVNEGEVFRYLNKPWDQEELKAVVAEAVQVAMQAEELRPAASRIDVDANWTLATATKLLAIDGIDSNRHQIMEMFTEDYQVLGAATIDDARRILEEHDVGVVITDCMVNGEDASELLEMLRERCPLVPVVLVSAVRDSDTIIRLINESRIYRFGMRPLAPNVFRLAVAAAIREHHRRLQEAKATSSHVVGKVEKDTPGDLASGIVNSLARFTKIKNW